MEPVSTALAGIALVKASVNFIKDNINTAKDIGDIAGQIDGLFRGQKEVNDSRNRKSGVGTLDQFGVESVAKETIDAKLAAESLQTVATMIDLRFGPGVWKGILAERQRRIQEAKEAALKARREALRAHNEMMDMVRLGLTIFFVAAVALGAFILVVLSARA